MKKREKKKIIKNERKLLLEVKYNFKGRKLSPQKEKKETQNKKKEKIKSEKKKIYSCWQPREREKKKKEIAIYFDADEREKQRGKINFQSKNIVAISEINLHF